MNCLRLKQNWLLAASVLTTLTTGSAQSVSLDNAPASVTPGQSYSVRADYQLPGAGIVQIQFIDSGWGQVADAWRTISSGAGSETLPITIPAGTPTGGSYRWQAVLYTSNWVKLDEDVMNSVAVAPAGASLSMTAPATVSAGGTAAPKLDYTLPTSGILQIQFFDSNWNRIAESNQSVAAGTGSKTFSVPIPAGTAAGTAYRWQGLLYDAGWNKKREVVKNNVTVSATTGTDYIPAGNWNLEWQDEFTGPAGSASDPKITKWYPFLGYTPTDFTNNAEKGLRWSNGNDPNTAQMFSTKRGNHWRDGSGHLLVQVAHDKGGPTNFHGTHVNAAYLLSGYPANWDSTEPTGVKWLPGNGKFVSPQGGDLYITARVRTDKVKGWSTWFAFWLFTETRAYNGTPSNGTEVDVIEIAKGSPNYLLKSFNVANHYSTAPNTSESKQFSAGTTPPSTSFVDVTDSNFHTYAIEWSANPARMKCSVDGQVYYTFNQNVPTNPVDMMMLLTMEFQRNAWDPNQGDGRTAGPFVSETSTQRVMSQALVDYVRVYRKQ